MPEQRVMEVLYRHDDGLLMSSERSWIHQMIARDIIKALNANTITTNSAEVQKEGDFNANTAEDVNNSNIYTNSVSNVCPECGGNGFIWNNIGIAIDCPKCLTLSSKGGGEE